MAQECHFEAMSLFVKTAEDSGIEDLDGADGYTAHQLFGSRKNPYAYTFDDLIVMPGNISNNAAADISLESHITKRIKLKVPLLSSPMDTVTEHEMAIGMALQGAIGVIHYNMTVEEQCKEVKLVKKYKNGFITDPACLSPLHTIAAVDELKAKHGYSGIPITVDGKIGSKLVGNPFFLTQRGIILTLLLRHRH